MNVAPRHWERKYFPTINTGSDGSEFVSAAQHAFIEFLLTPGHGTMAEWARQNDVPASTCSAWKRERFFKEEWERQARKLNVGIERIQNVVDAMFAAAMGGDTKAMSMYLQYVKEFIPTSKVVHEDGSVKNMTDEELATELEGTVTQLRSAKG